MLKIRTFLYLNFYGITIPKQRPLAALHNAPKNVHRIPSMIYFLNEWCVSTNRKRYKEELDLVVHAQHWENKFEEIMQLNQLTQFDDMTLMLLIN